MRRLPDGYDVIRIDFDRTHTYGSEVDGIAVPIILRSGYASAWLTAKIDTGASHCLFERGQGEILGLDIESGERKFFSTVTGRVETFGHLVQIETLGVVVDSMAYFFARRSDNQVGAGTLRLAGPDSPRHRRLRPATVSGGIRSAVKITPGWIDEGKRDSLLCNVLGIRMQSGASV